MYKRKSIVGSCSYIVKKTKFCNVPLVQQKVLICAPNNCMLNYSI